MKKILPALLLLVFLGCKKSAQPTLQVRVQNETNFVLDSVQLTYDASHYSYGTISQNTLTSYHAFNSLPIDASATVIINGEQILAGRLFPPNSYPYPGLSAGNYTLKIFADTTVPSGFNGAFVQ